MTKTLQADNYLTRRSLLGGALTLGGGAAVAAAAPQASAATTAPAAAAAARPIQTTVSAAMNNVETDSGKVYGSSRDGVIRFHGIPYAASTEGPNRFMPPQRPKPWTGIRSALYWGWVCPQTYNSSANGMRLGWTHDDESFMFEWEDGKPSEDCLRLNVWTPGLDNKKRAILFWIHGGGMTSGSAYELHSYDGENLARQMDVVVVSINHRLGVLGFLNLAEHGDQYASSGNVSMLDIIEALKWVQTNISNFGGDPGQVMIFGQSGGGSKVGTIMGMPAASGLFHRASIQSGSGLRQATMESSQKLAQATLAELGISKTNIEKLHTDFTFRQLVEAGMEGQRKAAAGNAPAVPGGRGGGWGPVVDGNLIPRHTWDPAAPDSSAAVPLMVGTVLNEMFNSVQMGDASLEGMDMTEAKRRLTPLMRSHTDHVVEVAQKLYPIATPFEIFSLASAMRQRLNAYTQAELKTKQGAESAYLYRSEWKSPLCDGRARAFHTSELPFCFHNVEQCAKLVGNTPESHLLAGRVAGAWAAFAKTGNPNHAGIPKWESYNDNVPTMVFDKVCALKNDPDGDLRKAILETVA